MDFTFGEIAQFIPGVLVGLFCLGYAVFIFVKGGVHVRGKGWRTKSEAPKSYYFTLISMALIGLSMIIQSIIRFSMIDK
jgi:hypothetical protein